MARREAGYMRWLNALVLLGLGWLAILIELAPVGGRASATPSPDLLFCVAAYLVIRRRASTPASLILLLGLARDLIGGGAVGLGALTLLGATEVLRLYQPWLRRRSFLTELAMIGLLTIAISIIHVLVLTITFAPSPALETLGLGALATIGAYILVAGFFRYALRLRVDPPENRTVLGGGR